MRAFDSAHGSPIRPSFRKLGHVDPRLKLLNTVSWCSRPIPGERLRALLLTLAEAGPRGLSADALIDAIWADDPPDHPSKALQILVSRTRTQTTAEAIERTATGYRLALPTDDIDLWALDILTTDAEVALTSGDITRALELARTAIDLDVDSRAVRVIALATSKQGRHREALPELTRLHESAPFDEELTAEYLRALAGAEGTPAALHAYADIQTRLADDLGSRPGPALQAVHEELLALDRPVRSGVRYPATSLLGRDDDLDRVTGLLSSARLVTIVGPGGLGKTRLAQELARLSPLPHVRVVELATVRQPDEVMGAVAEALQVRETISRIDRQTPLPDLQSRIVAQLSMGPNLLVLDNCEHLVGAVSDLVSDLLSAVSDLRILTTSRTPLRLTAEHTYYLDQLPGTEAIELFSQRARAVRPSVTLNRPVVAELVEHLDGLPLAIELAAARTRTHSPETILDNVARRFELLRGGDRSAPARHQTLSAVIDWSWQLLGEDSRRALAHLALLPDAFSADCAEVVLGSRTTQPAVTSPLRGVNPLDSVTDLVDQSLITVIERGDEVRFRMLETIREYGLLKLDESGGRAQAEAAVDNWAISLCAEAVPDIMGSAQLRAVGVLRSEEHNLAHVLRRLLDRRDDDTVTMLAALLPCWMVTGEHIHIVTHFDLIERFLSTWTMPDHLAEMTRQVLAVETTTWGMLPRWHELPETRRVLKQLGPDSDEPFIRALARLGIAIIEAEEPGQSAEDFARFHALSESDDRFTRLLAAPFLAGIKENAGEVGTSITLLEDAMADIRADDPPWLSTRYRESLSQLHLQLGNFAEALEHARIALPTLNDLGDTVECRSVLAFAHLNLGEMAAAEAELDALAMSNDHDEPYRHRYMLMLGRAELAFMRGRVDEGLTLLDRALEAGSDHASLPGVPTSDGLDPWILVSAAVSTAVRARCSPAEVDEQKRENAFRDAEQKYLFLLDKAERATAQHRGHYDFPVLGTVAFALAAWGHHREGVDEDQIATLMALADRLSYNRGFPSLNWRTLADGLTTDQIALLESETRTLADLASAEVIVRLHDCAQTMNDRLCTP